MYEMYERIESLCIECGIKPGKLCADLGISRGIMGDLKAGRTKQLSAENLSKISTYFNVPIDFLLGRPPFNNWEQIEQNREYFLKNVKIHPETIKEIWGIDPVAANSSPLVAFIQFISNAIDSAEITTGGEWNIKEKGFKVHSIEQFKRGNKTNPNIFAQKETAPTLTKKDERDIEKRLEAVLEDLENAQGGLAFSGEPLDEVTRELLAESLRNSMRIGKTLAKQKFTPKKYRKD